MDRQELLEKLRLEQEKNDFFVMLSHDLKNPLTAVIGAIDILREGRLGPVTSEQTDYLYSAIDSCNEVVTMIDNLLDIRHFEAGTLQMSICHLNPAEIVRTTSRSFERAAGYDRITFIADIIDPPFNIAAEKKALVRIVSNLLGNSLKFTPEGGEITVSCRCITDIDLKTIGIPPYVTIPAHFADRRCFVSLSVHDSGNGFPTAQLERIFDRLAPSKNAEGRERGAARLGLAYCKYAVESFNGVIWAESKAGEGSKVIMLFPCVTKQVDLCPNLSEE